MKNNQKGFTKLVLIGVVVVLVGVVGWIWFKNNSGTFHCDPGPCNTKEQTQNIPTQDSEDVSTPIIYSVSPTSGPIGTKITIKGKNLNGFEGDLNARIATEFNPADYSSGIMYGERTGSTDTITTTIKSSFCEQDTSYSGLPCKSYFKITPGVYEISVKPYGKESNSVSFTVTK